MPYGDGDCATMESTRRRLLVVHRVGCLASLREWPTARSGTQAREVSAPERVASKSREGTRVGGEAGIVVAAAPRRSLRRRLRDACPNREWGAPVGFERAQQALTESNAGDKGACVAKRVYVCQFWKKWRACHQVKSSRVKIEQNRVKLESRLQSGRTMVLMATATAANPPVKSLGQIPWSTPPWSNPLTKTSENL